MAEERVKGRSPTLRLARCGKGCLLQSPTTALSVSHDGRRTSMRKDDMGAQARRLGGSTLVTTVLALAACTGSTSTGPQAAPSPSRVTSVGPSTDPACRSPDRPGLIPCEEAIRRAWEHGAPSIPSGVTARLRTFPAGRLLAESLITGEPEGLGSAFRGPRGCDPPSCRAIQFDLVDGQWIARDGVLLSSVGGELMPGIYFFAPDTPG
jgi:hypothetical protein